MQSASFDCPTLRAAALEADYLDFNVENFAGSIKTPTGTLYDQVTLTHGCNCWRAPTRDYERLGELSYIPLDGYSYDGLRTFMQKHTKVI